ncbi:hypothetical protein HMI56_007574 [Coelomomyces lativittatus]|nr:hypothetical protein HMI56_007574 [Coelomomyces lativittatus]
MNGNYSSKERFYQGSPLYAQTDSGSILLPFASDVNIDQRMVVNLGEGDKEFSAFSTFILDKPGFMLQFKNLERYFESPFKCYTTVSFPILRINDETNTREWVPITLALSRVSETNFDINQEIRIFDSTVPELKSVKNFNNKLLSFNFTCVQLGEKENSLKSVSMYMNLKIKAPKRLPLVPSGQKVENLLRPFEPTMSMVRPEDIQYPAGIVFECV